jgi:hypothetical protein
MPPTPSSAPSAPSPSGSYRRHRRQTVWQIWVPLGVFCLVILAMAVGIVWIAIPGGTSPAIAGWSYVSQTLLVIPVMAVAIIILAITAGLVYLMARLLKVLPAYTQLAQAYVHLASVIVRVWADRIASPMIKIHGAWAGWQTLRRRIFG